MSMTLSNSESTGDRDTQTKIPVSKLEVLPSSR
jgi:hypothetical protein